MNFRYTRRLPWQLVLIVIVCTLSLIIICDAKKKKKKEGQDFPKIDPVGQRIGETLRVADWHECGKRPAFEANEHAYNTKKNNYPRFFPFLHPKKRRAGASKRIKNGEEVFYGEFPSYATVYHTWEGVTGLCGGVLIGNVTVLTAAHCVQNWHRDNITVYLGVTQYDYAKHVDHTELSFHEQPGYEVFKVQSVCVSSLTCKALPVQMFRHLARDVAVLWLDRPVTFSDHIQPVCFPLTLPQLTNDTYHPYNETEGIFDAVGRGLGDDGMSGGRLKRMQISPSGCSSHEQQEYDDVDLLDHSLKCYRGKKGSICGGDSGSPIYYYQLDEAGFARQYLAGLVSGRSNDHNCKKINELTDSYIITDTFGLRRTFDKMTNGSFCMNPYGLELGVQKLDNFPVCPHQRHPGINYRKPNKRQ